MRARMLLVAALLASCGDPPPPAVEVFAPARTIAVLDVVEDLSEEVADRLVGLAEALAGRDLDAAAGWLTEDFVGAVADRAPVAATRALPAGARRVERDVAAAEVVDRAGWLASWERMLAPLERVEHVALALTAAEFEPGTPPRGRVRVRANAHGRTAGGGMRALELRALAEVASDLGAWKLRRWAPEATTVTTRDAPLFTNVTEAAGVAHRVGRYGPDVAPDFVWNGAACGDVDGDGRWDLFVPSQERSFLYRNAGDLTFAEEAAARGLAGDANGTGALFFDRDEDGDADLVVGHVAWLDSMRLYDNDGGAFSDVTEASGLSGRHVAYSLCAGDFDGNGATDVYVCSYNRETHVSPESWTDARNGTPNALYVNRGDGTFADEAAARGADDGRWSYAAGAADFDRDGDLDLYVANDYGTNALLVNRGDGVFDDRAAEHGVLDVGNGMAVAWGDLHNDGLADLYVANMSSVAGQRIVGRLVEDGPLPKLVAGNTVYRATADGGFEAVPAEAGGVEASWAWSAQLTDVDLDGHEDVLVTNGFLSGATGMETTSTYWRHVVASSATLPGVTPEEPGNPAYNERQMAPVFEGRRSFAGYDRDRVYLNAGDGTFVDLSAISGADDPGDGRALLVADFDDDGDGDVFVHNIQGDRHALYRNDAGAGGSVKVRLRGTRGARDAAGAEVRLHRDDGAVATRVHALGSGFVSQNAPELVFGLGDVPGGDLVVVWPGGREERFGRAEAGDRRLLVEGAGR